MRTPTSGQFMTSGHLTSGHLTRGHLWRDYGELLERGGHAGSAPEIQIGPAASVPHSTRGLYVLQDAVLTACFHLSKSCAIVRYCVLPWRGYTSVMAESPTEPREIIATCRAARGTAYASQSEGTGVDGTALAVYSASCEKLEELGCPVEERPAELEVMLVEDGPPYDI
jgi:hypothetical protein